MQENDKEISPVKQRILQYIDSKGITLYKCYKETGISKNILSQKNGISEENLIRFLTTYKDVSPIWIVLGEGNMLLEESTAESPEKKKKDVEKKIQEVTPDFLLKRFEELVIENNELKLRLKAEKNEMQGLSGTGSTAEASAVPIKLNP